MDKQFKDIVLYEIRQNRKAIRDLERNTIVLSTKFKVSVALVSFTFGTIGSILWTKLKLFL